MANRTLLSDVKENGVNQGDLVKAINNLVDAVNELIADHATFKTVVDEMNTDADAVFADLTAIRTAVVGITAKLDADAGVTDTNYASTLDPAALTATAIAATGPASLTSTTLTLTKG